MPLQNRVTPFGDVVAVPQRGLLTGNRGIIHDPATRTLLRRRWTTPAWIVCTLDLVGANAPRAVMATRSWTELFFLDEATALAAGHRPCFFCRRAAATAFRDAWAAGHGGPVPRAAAIDRALHAQRLAGPAKRLHPLPDPAADLPDGTMVAAEAAAFLVRGGRLLRWSHAGYGAAAPGGAAAAPQGPLALLTPPATVRALAAGYRPLLHPSARDAAL